MAGFVFANSPEAAGPSNPSGEEGISLALIGADLVSCIVALPGEPFSSAQIFVCV